LNFACPICGDSEKSIYKKRANIYYKNANFVCFNCNEKMSFTKLCDRFNENISLDKRIEIYNYIDSVTVFNKMTSDYVNTELDKLIDLDNFIKYFNNRKNSWLTNISRVKNNSGVYQHLKFRRYISNFDSILEGTYNVIKEGKIVYKTRVAIFLNILKSENKIVGVQLRNLTTDKNKRFYKIVDFETIYNYMNPGKLLDEIEAVFYNKISHFYNIMNVDFNKKVTIFEGVTDTYFYPNSIGLIGTNSTDDVLKFLLDSSDDLDLQFFFDNDDAGYKIAIRMILNGYNVFLWKKLFEDIINKSKDKLKMRKKLSNIDDLNRFVIVSKNPNLYKKLNLDNYFSIDKFDLMYINKPEKKKFENNYYDKKRKTY